MFIVVAMHGTIIHLYVSLLIGAGRWSGQVTPNSATLFCAMGFMLFERAMVWGPLYGFG
tara:strand:- start:935 stop:1111 length:177 start_codon:yes stop_codon:yes gene_type:complete